MLSESEIRSFSEDGFLIIPGAFPREDVVALIRATEDPAIQQELEVRRAQRAHRTPPRAHHEAPDVQGARARTPASLTVSRA